ncbi:hypothetical protein, partial [Acinetobacter baumannii]|uniref:hypothetical protein n=1 Tax=Acinetobacter baumannii TaxID=470 RepID=UPI0028918DF3
MTTLPGRAGACAARRTAIWLAIALSCIYPLAFLLPPAWALENGAVENLQAAILACGCLLA